MKTLNLSALDSPLKILLYGHSGSGKTTLAGSLLSLESMQPAAYCSLDRSGAVLRNIPNIRGVVLEETDDAFRFLEACDSGSLKDCPYVIVDGLGAFLDMALVDAAEKASGAKEKREKGEFVAPPSEIPFTLYSGAYTVLKNFTKGILALNKTVVCTTWVASTFPKKKVGKNYERAEVPSSIHPLFPDKIRDNLVGAFDCVWYMQSTDEGPAMLTSQKGVTHSRTRDPNFRAAIEQVIRCPCLVELYELYQKSQQSTK